MVRKIANCSDFSGLVDVIAEDGDVDVVLFVA